MFIYIGGGIIGRYGNPMAGGRLVCTPYRLARGQIIIIIIITTATTTTTTTAATTTTTTNIIHNNNDKHTSISNDNDND